MSPLSTPLLMVNAVSRKNGCPPRTNACVWLAEKDVREQTDGLRAQMAPATTGAV